MLNILHIENVAVIEKADIEFSSGLNVLTGETGAGKSIIIDSIGALLGDKVTRDIVRRNSDYAIVTGSFDAEPATEWLNSNGIEFDDEIVIQRKISSDGKSSCRINGIPVTVAQLKELGPSLVDIHGQNDGRALLDEKRHLAYLDNFGKYACTLSAYKEAYAEYCSTVRELKRLSIDEIEKERLTESLNYQLKELKGAELKPGEYDSSCSRRDLLRNSEKLSESINEALSMLLGDSDTSVSSQLQNSMYYTQKASDITCELSDVNDKLKEASFLISDAAETLEDFKSGLDFSPEEYDNLELRISQLNRLMRKYGKDESELIDYISECEKRLDEIEYSDDMKHKLAEKLKKQTVVCSSEADRLTSERKMASKELESGITAELKDLNMPSAKFMVEFVPVSSECGFDANGNTDVRFVMSANAGEEIGRISRIASGGEMSRIMLAMKNVFAENDPVSTMIFDEIDSGVSGIAGQKVAEKLYRVSVNKQVMCVTHLPQIAAMADHQFSIVKSEHDGRTFTVVNELDRDGRKRELARLYGGDNVSPVTLRTAEEQLSASEAYKKSVSAP